MNHLYYGDNLEVLRDSIADASVDLIYLDPPFNSNASYNVLFKGPKGNESAAQIEAFDDTWHWTDAAEAAFAEVLHGPNAHAATMLRAMRGFLGENDMMAYLAMMAVRLLELHRVLKPTGSLYLHCDPTASHYLKILLDAVFGKDKMLNELVWKRTFAHGSAKRWGPVHDTIFYFGKSNVHLWADHRVAHDASYIEKHFTAIDEATGRRFSPITLTGAGTRRGDSGKPWRGIDPTDSGRHWALPSKVLEAIGVRSGTVQERLDRLDDAGFIFWPAKEGGKPRLKHFADTLDGMALSDVINDIPPISAQSAERLGYPTQKPVALLERILSASSNPGDVVLDPFCGCGTTVHAAEKLDRKWIGIDVTHLAIGLIEKRLRDAFPKVEFQTHGVPQDISGARDLAARGRGDRNYYFEFEKWALSLIAAQPGNFGKKGADRGIDGRIPFGPKSEGLALVSVKAGDNVGVSMIRDLRGTIEREGADIGVFLTLAEPTRPMVAEAAAAGHCELPGFAPVPKVQIVTVEEAMRLGHRAVDLPARRDDTFRRAARETDPSAQGEMDL